MVWDEKEQNKMPENRNIEGKVSSILGELQELSLEREKVWMVFVQCAKKLDV